MNDEWTSVNVMLPKSSGRYKVLVDAIGIRFSDFDSDTKHWDVANTVTAWKNEFEKMEQPPVPDVNKNDMILMNHFDNPEMVALTNLAETELHRIIGSINVDIKVYTISEDANITVAGRVLAISESFAAQQTGHDSLVIHDRDRLSKNVNPGDEVTIKYTNGVGDVYPGVTSRNVVKVTCDELLRDEISMIEAKIAEIIDKLIEGGMTVTNKVIDTVVKRTIEKISEVEGWNTSPEEVVVKQVKAIDMQEEMLSNLNRQNENSLKHH